MDFQKANTEITRFGTMSSIVRLQEALKAIDPEICIYNNHQTTLECLVTPLLVPSLGCNQTPHF